MQSSVREKAIASTSIIDKLRGKGVPTAGQTPTDGMQALTDQELLAEMERRRKLREQEEAGEPASLPPAAY